MKLRKFLAVLLALVLTLGTTAFAADAFTDVAGDAYYADAVEWAAEKKITTGYEDGTFRPERTVNRAEAVTFLWRMAGEPEPTGIETFDDVERDANNWWYKTAVRWAVENGITNGTGSGFSPYVTCNRGMILTMLYRMQGCPFDEILNTVLPEDEESWTLEETLIAFLQIGIEAYRSATEFTDVKEGAWYETPVLWALSNGILGENQVAYTQEDERTLVTVKPDEPCVRGEMAYFLYYASGDAPQDGAVATGRIPETVLLEQDGVKITATRIRPEGLTDAIVDLTVENGTDKFLSVDADEFYVNSYALSPQVCIPTEDEDGWIFYADAVAAPGETTACELRLNALDEQFIFSIYELELRMVLAEVERNEEDGGYDYVDAYTVGDTAVIRTSLYDERVPDDDDIEEMQLIEKDGLQVFLLKAENGEYSGPEITLCICNNGSGDALLELAEMKLDGESVEGFFGMDPLPAGKRLVTSVSVFITDFDNVPVAEEAELTFAVLDPETWETVGTLDPVTVPFAD